MIINVCSCGSSGSTLLAYLLNRHPDIACGEELELFSKPVIYYNFKILKKYYKIIKKFGISSNPHFNWRAIFTELDLYQLDETTVWNWIKTSRTIFEFVNKFNHYIITKTAKNIWAEKTPNNIFLIREFLTTFNDAKVIHIIRDPRDVVLSLIKRSTIKDQNLKLLKSGERWLTSVAAIQQVRKHVDVLEIRYEDLISRPDNTLKKVCDHIGIKFSKDFFLTDKYESKFLKRHMSLKTWNNSIDDGFSNKSIGKYKKSDVQFDKLYSLKLSNRYAEVLNTESQYLVNLAHSYGYCVGVEIKECLNKPLYDITGRRTAIRNRILGFFLNDNFRVCRSYY